jgi:hypothetical protein
MAGRLTKVGKAFYLFTMPGHPFPDSSVLTNSARSYLRRADFLMVEHDHAYERAYLFQPKNMLEESVQAHTVVPYF